MKQWIVLGFVTLGLMSFDQNGKGKGNQKEKDKATVQSEVKGHGNGHAGKGGDNHPGKGKPDKVADGVTHQEQSKGPKDKGPKDNGKSGKVPPGHQKHPEHSNGNAYGKKKDGLSGREFGQRRAQEARSKHRPKNEAEAVTIIEVVHQQNMTLLERIEDKIEEARDRLRERVRIGELAEDLFKERQSRIEQLASRRKEIATALFKL